MNCKFVSPRKRSKNFVLCFVDTVQLAVVCESLITFAIYGKMNHFKNKTPEEEGKRKNANHKQQLIKDLKLDPRHYKEMFDENPFHGLEYCGRNLKTHGNRLSWEGFCSLEKTMFQNLVDDLTDTKYNRDRQASDDDDDDEAQRETPAIRDAKNDADVMHDILQQLVTLRRRNFPDEYDGPFTVLCDMIWKTLLKHCNRVTKAADETILPPEHGLVARIKSFERRHVTFSSAKTFVEDLFGQTQYLKYIGFAHYLRDMYQQLNPPNQLALRKKLVMFIEDMLLTLESPALLYPFGGVGIGGRDAKLNYNYAILPFCGGIESSYARASDDVKRRIKILYSFAFERKYEEKCSDMLLHDALLAASTFEGPGAVDAYLNQLESKRVDDLLSNLYIQHLAWIWP